MPRSKTSAYRSRVQSGMIFGGNDAATPSDLKLVSTIHRTGKKNTSVTSQVNAVIRCPATLRRVNGFARDRTASLFGVDVAGACTVVVIRSPQ